MFSLLNKKMKKNRKNQLYTKLLLNNVRSLVNVKEIALLIPVIRTLTMSMEEIKTFTKACLLTFQKNHNHKISFNNKLSYLKKGKRCHLRQSIWQKINFYCLLKPLRRLFLLLKT